MLHILYCTVLYWSFATPQVNQNCQFLQLVLQIFMHKIYMNTKKIYMNTNKFCINTHEFAWKHMNFTWTWINFPWTRVNFAWTRMKVYQNFRVCRRYLGHVTVSEIGSPIFVAVFEGPIILLKICEFIYKYHHYIHCSIYLYAPAPSLKKCNFCYEQIYLSLAGKGLICKLYCCVMKISLHV